MSFAGSVVLAAIGAASYKYDPHQQSVPHPLLGVSLREFPQGVYWTKVIQLRVALGAMLLNFFGDFFTGAPFAYPFKAVAHFARNAKRYSHTMLSGLIVYLISFSIVLFVYWATVAPLYAAFFALLGPLGLVLAGVHSVLHANMLTMMFMRLAHISNPAVLDCINGPQGIIDFRPDVPVRYYVPFMTWYFWLYHMPLRASQMVLGLIVLLVLLAVSSFPLLGPVMFTVIVSPWIAKIYLSKLFRMDGLSKRDRENHFVEHMGFFVSFGLAAGLLEVLPILSGFVLTTNSIATALWFIDSK
ncbi:Lds1p KNAG_0D04790 [Huiozyma naganishii CBS 8797]|uniref:Uncharacterized protein n=1 Tax=Huiozyma naganishii (strain ATCC MYA-139 / BCRC 22969 / CBS 8797 / KCTC 17520 / NBRC 10181 / NCYC 3082 / Yp74L-3) TaxID=1071383 RepID=J7S660_HUIN7|nr:hypothetical protein KNAG_0D04790 [Kazachstania naganishii CBS 8797]CCK70219.1 hypothetical protein KNAG_0D04790 [Kazachstania naganishii CBS 8797]